MKFRKVLAVIMIAMIVLTLAGCNYVGRPKGAINHGEDLSGKLSDLLIIPEFDYEEQPEEDRYVYVEPDEPEEPKDEPEEPKDEPEEPTEPDPVYTPFTSTYDAATLLSKIEDLVSTVQASHGVANSATGVSDELLSGRTIKILVPDDFPIDDENAAVQAMTAKYNCAVVVKRVGTGSAYTAACRRATLSGEKADLMYVDNSVWGDVHTFTQVIDSYINMELGDELGTFNSYFTKKFYVPDALETTTLRYYVASGIGAPYLLAYNKANIKSATLAEGTATVENAPVTLREIQVTDPVEMYNNRTWSVSAFTEMLKASTSGTNVGLASEMDALEGLDIWYGMIDASGMTINSTTSVAAYGLTLETNKSVDAIENWYWNAVGVDGKNHVGDFADAEDWDDLTIYDKLFNRYSGSDDVKSYSFIACETPDLLQVNAAAYAANEAEWDFVAYPYGTIQEQTNRAYGETEFNELVAADKEAFGVEADYEKEIITPAAGWVGGFAVLKNCENPSIALRIAEEYTKIWKAEYETPALEIMTEEQQARYEDMKANIGVSFVRGWAEKAADLNTVYPNVTEYFYGYKNKGSITSFSPEDYSIERALLLATAHFDGNAQLAVHPMYHKYEATKIYNPVIQATWSDWAWGAESPEYIWAKDTVSIMKILNASLLPPTIMFNW